MKAIRAVYVHVRSNRRKFPFLLSSRFYTLSQAGDVEETWIYLDEYLDEESYDNMSKALLADKTTLELRKTWDKVIVNGSFKTELWKDFAPDLWIE